MSSACCPKGGNAEGLVRFWNGNGNASLVSEGTARIRIEADPFNRAADTYSIISRRDQCPGRPNPTRTELNDAMSNPPVVPFFLFDRAAAHQQ
jgi:hypothetical protein